MELQLKIIGIVLIVLSAIHIPFPGYFKWKKELQSLSLINIQMMYVHTFFVAFMVFLMGILCVSCSGDIVSTRLGKYIALGISAFWGVRLFIQFFVYSPKLWRGKLFETVIHIVFSLLWLYLTITFFLIYYN
jgi:hypothetical protein